ncbi:hypothetical protein [Nocardia colli]|uniref:hypothetical protein n=1 Tax=Nocardia colli TaxID=2545717 RepID=UPI0035D5B7E0
MRNEIHSWYSTPPPQNALIPFGGGARNCIAARWRLSALAGNDMRPALAVTLHPRRLRMRAEIRTPATAATAG